MGIARGPAVTGIGGANGTLMEQVRAEYAAMPGLSVTLAQAQRLWAVDRQACEDVFKKLVRNGVLRMTAKGRFVLTEDGHARVPTRADLEGVRRSLA